MRIADVQATAHAHLSRLLNASPSVIYCRQATNNYQPTFVSQSIAEKKYFENPDLWKQRVHHEDVDRLAAWVAATFEGGERSIEYRYRRKDGHLIFHQRKSDVRESRSAIRAA